MMVASEFLDYLSKFQVATYVGVEDFADKFNFLITVVILLLCTTIVTVKQYMMKPISCYMATDLGGKNLLDYVENYCWVQGTVPISYAGRIPETEEGWAKLQEHKLLYYQWVPFVLGLQCILFYIPRLIWQMICYNRTGTDIQHLILSANQAVHATDEQRKKMIDHVARTLEQMLFQRRVWKNQKLRAVSHNRHLHSQTATGQHSTVTPRQYLSLNDRKVSKQKNLGSSEDEFCGSSSDFYDPGVRRSAFCSAWMRCLGCIRLGHYRGAYLSFAYLLMKILYLGNAVGQLFMMQYFLGFSTKQSMFGVAILQNILHGRDWQSTLIFPRVAFCYVRLRHMGTANNVATAQCVLPVNMLNEKIYIFLWWWVLLAATLTTLSLVRWSIRMVSSTDGGAFIRKYLILGNQLVRTDAIIFEQFVKSFLKKDGVFLLRMISYNADELVATDVLSTVWSWYRERNQPKRNDNKKMEDGEESGDKPGETAAVSPPHSSVKTPTQHSNVRSPRGQLGFRELEPTDDYFEKSDLGLPMAKLNLMDDMKGAHEADATDPAPCPIPSRGENSTILKQDGISFV